MLVELRALKHITYLARRTERVASKPVEFPEIDIPWEKMTDAEAAFVALMNIFSPTDLTKKEDFKFLSTIEPTYHEANGYFFKIHPVKLNDDGTNTYLIERKKRMDDATPLDRLEIIRNVINPRDVKTTNLSYRKQLEGKGGTELICLSNKRARTEAYNFLASMNSPRPQIALEWI